MWLAILLLIVLGIRGRLEVRIQNQEQKIFELEHDIKIEMDKIIYLKERLEPLKYMQPLEQIDISSSTGIRVNPMGGGKEKLHKGLDLKGETGDSVYSVLPGIIVGNWMPPGWYGVKYYYGHPVLGGCIIIDHGNYLYSIYGHLSITIVREDQWVEAGEKIGELGNTGPSTGPHLHFEITMDPLKYLNERIK